MAWLERDRPNGPFQIVFQYGDRRVKRSSSTRNEQEATELAARVERRLQLIKQGDLAVPEDVDPILFLMSDGTQLSTLSSVWSVARTRELVTHAFANKGLRYPKIVEKL